LLLVAAELTAHGLEAVVVRAGIRQAARLSVLVFRFQPRWGQAVLAQTAAVRHLTHYRQPAEVVVVLIFPQGQAVRARGTGQLTAVGVALPVLRGKATTAALRPHLMTTTGFL
jgi:hypothetical protein